MNCPAASPLLPAAIMALSQPLQGYQAMMRACAHVHTGRADALVQLRFYFAPGNLAIGADGTPSNDPPSPQVHGTLCRADREVIIQSSGLLPADLLVRRLQRIPLHHGAPSSFPEFRGSLPGSWEAQRHLHIFRFMTGPATSSEKRATLKKPPAPDAGACDEALEDYQELKSRLDKLQKPSTIQSWPQLIIGASKTVGNGIVATVRFTMSVPKRIADFRAMPKEEWARKKASAWKTVKHEAHHYWVGTKLLWFDVKISSRLAMKAARGLELSRRERKQLTRTAADLFRLVPMVVIMVVPFLEFPLPVLLRIFPNMLPSTYEDKLKKEEELKRRLSVKLELAKFLQDTVAEVAKDISRRKGSGSAKELYEFIKKVRSGEPVDNAEILKFAQLFNDELTLDNLERVQLVSICQFVGIAPFGTDAFLRSRLRSQLQQIKQDDYEIEKEGLENLTEEELRAACRARGMRAPYGEGAITFMRRQMHDWLDLSLHRGLPSSLLLLSRAFTITAQVRDVAQKKDMAYEKLKETLSVIPEEVVDKVGYEALGGAEATSVESLQKKLDLLKREEALIKEELTRAAVAAANQKAAAAVLAASPSAPTPASAAVQMMAAGTAAEKAEAAQATAASAAKMLVTEALSAESVSEEEKAAVSAEQKQRRLHKTVQALMDLAAGSGVAKERTLFMELIKNETDRLYSDLAKSAKPAGGNLVFSNKGMESGGDSSAGDAGGAVEAAPKQLADRVSRMLHDIEKELDNVERTIGGKMHLLDQDNDGVISQKELENAVCFLKEQLSPDELQQLYEQLASIEAQAGGGSPGSIQMSNLLELAANRKQDKGEEAGAHPADVVKIHMK